MQKIFRNKIKNNYSKFIEQYLMVKFGKLDINEWFDKAITIIDECMAIDPAEPLYGLMKAHAYLLFSKKDEAVKILDNVEKYNEELFEYSQFQYAYYLYLQCICNKNNVILLEKVNGVLSNIVISNPKDWRVQWFQLQLKDKYKNDVKEKYYAIKKSFKEGCRSPIMYFEACQILDNKPNIINKIGPFETQVLNWGVKNTFIKRNLALHVSKIIQEYHPLTFKLVKSLYRLFENNQILKSICIILIKGRKTHDEAFAWYQLGLKEQLQINQLQDYYLYSIKKQDFSPLPAVVVRDFMYNIDLTEDSKAYLYANILKNKEEMGNNFKDYLKIIINFAETQIKRGKLDRWLAYIYEQLLLLEVIPNKYIATLINLVFSSHIECNNKDIQNVVIIHREIKKEIVITLKQGEATIPIFTDNYHIVFIDKDGKRYTNNIDYKLTKYFTNKSYLLKYCNDGYTNDALLVYIACKSLEDKKVDDFSIKIYNKLLTTKGLSDVFKMLIVDTLVSYYHKTNNLKELSNCLSQVSLNHINGKERYKMIEYYISLNLDIEALKFIEDYGYEQISIDKLLKLCSQIISKKVKTPILLELSFYLFKSKKHNDKIIEYLVQNYSGSMIDMYELWKVSKNYIIDSSVLEEKMIQQVLYTEMFKNEHVEVFQHFYKNHKDSTIVRPFINFLAYQHMIYDIDLPVSFYNILREQYDKGVRTLTCKYTLLKWYSIKENLTVDEKKWVEKNIYEAITHKKVLPWFKRFDSNVLLPDEVREKAYIEYITIPNIKVNIHYRYDWEDNYNKIPMRHIGLGIYVSSFMMFFNENVQYYIEEIKENGSKIITESNDFTCEIVGQKQVQTAYDMINTMVMSHFMKDDTTLLQSLEEYICYQNKIKKYFKALA